MKQFYIPLLLIFFIQTQAQQLTGYSPEGSQEQLQLEEEFRSRIDRSRFKTHLKKLTERPHIAGTPNNEKVRNYMMEIMETLL